jgi:hypothetical protein
MNNNMTIAFTIYAHAYVTYVHTQIHGPYIVQVGLAVTLYKEVPGSVLGQHTATLSEIFA